MQSFQTSTYTHGTVETALFEDGEIITSRLGPDHVMVGAVGNLPAAILDAIRQSDGGISGELRLRQMRNGNSIGPLAHLTSNSGGGGGYGYPMLRLAEKNTGGIETTIMPHQASFGGDIQFKKVVSAGNNIIFSVAGPLETYSTSLVELASIRPLVPYTGTLRIAFRLQVGSGHVGSGSTAYAQIYRNTTAVGTLRSIGASGNITTFTEDISGWTFGDRIVIRGRCSDPDYSRCVILFFQVSVL